MAAMPSSGSMTSPVPEISRIFSPSVAQHGVQLAHDLVRPPFQSELHCGALQRAGMLLQLHFEFFA